MTQLVPAVIVRGDSYKWRIGLVTTKTSQPPPGEKGSPAKESEITVQLTADQQVSLSITGQDKYGNPVEISGDVVWVSSDTSIVTVTTNKSTNQGSSATAVAVGPAGTAAVTVTNDVDRDGTGDFMGSIAIDVVAGNVAEIKITEGQVTDKNQPGQPDQGLPPGSPGAPDNSLPGEGNYPDQGLPPGGPEVEPPDPNRPDNSLPGGNYPDQGLPPGQPGVDHPDNSLPVPPGRQPKPSKK